MDAQATYREILGKTNEIALATAVNNIPHVRIVNFCFRAERPDVLYFSSDRENDKVREFSQNDVVAFTSVPRQGVAHVRSTRAAVRRSAYGINDLAGLFMTAIPGYDETITAIGDRLDVFEVHVSEAKVVGGLEEPELVTFNDEALA